MAEFFPSSDNLVNLAGTKSKQSKYPWHELPPGMSFVVPESDIKLESLVSLAYKTSKRLKKTFKVVHHKERHIYEVGRLADAIVVTEPQVAVADWTKKALDLKFKD